MPEPYDVPVNELAFELVKKKLTPEMTGAEAVDEYLKVIAEVDLANRRISAKRQAEKACRDKPRPQR